MKLLFENLLKNGHFKNEVIPVTFKVKGKGIATIIVI